MIHLDTYAGGSGTRVKETLLSLSSGVWYRALLKLDDEGAFIAQVWERDDPAVQATRHETLSGWTGREDWRFMAQAHTGVLSLDDYDELSFHTTRYAYDALDNLTTVTDTMGHTTVITYDNLGRKVAMDDPDMGQWGYQYDLLGNLITQTDALEQSIVFEYDDLNRLLTKSAAGQVLAAYSYDEGTGNIGFRTGMTYTNGVATYRYDARGRLLEEQRGFHMSGTTPVTYTVGYAYDALDRTTVITYPDGEVVTQTYDNRGLPLALIGDSDYVTHTVQRRRLTTRPDR